MSLQTDIAFIKALTQSEQIKAKVQDRIYNTAIPGSDEDVANTPLPYIIVTFDGFVNDDFTKDSEYEGGTDRVQIGIEVATEDRESLAELTTLIRNVILSSFYDARPGDEDYNLVPIQFTLSAKAVQYDPWKPCYWQVLNYQCDTNVE